MKVIISRKGFDSSYGGVPSPILPDGRIISLPIPSNNDKDYLKDIYLEDIDLEKMVLDLRGNRNQIEKVHLDPDLNKSAKIRKDGWKPTFGQSGTAQSHLKNNEIQEGDIFLYFGWFREVELDNGVWKYKRNSSDIHCLFGWLEIGSILSIFNNKEMLLNNYSWLMDHPHANFSKYAQDKKNTIYIAKEKSSYNQNAEFGGGIFKQFDKSLQLTKDGELRTVWSLPNWFIPNGRKPLTYHSEQRFRVDESDLSQSILRAAGRGQEFIIDGDIYPELENWVGNLIRIHG